VKDLFREWLAEHYPDRAQHVMSIINQSRGGKDYQAEFGKRMVGTGVFAELLRKRFQVAKRRLGLDEADGRFDLRTDLFRPPTANRAQMTLGF
jgi:DNA repair photolyase